MDNKKVALILFKAKNNLSKDELFALEYLLGHVDGAVGAAKSINNLSTEDAQELADDIFDLERLERDWNTLVEKLNIKARGFYEIVMTFKQ